MALKKVPSPKRRGIAPAGHRAKRDRQVMRPPKILSPPGQATRIAANTLGPGGKLVGAPPRGKGARGNNRPT